MASGGDKFHSLQQFDEKSAKLLGKGFFGEVKAMKCLDDDKMYAIKAVLIGYLIRQVDEDDKKKMKASIFAEAELMKQVEHPNIVKGFGSFRSGSEDSGTFYIVMELCEGGSLLHVINKSTDYFAEDLILGWTSQILVGLRYLHKNKILHRDIKAENIFLDAELKIAKIGDFGISKSFSKTNITSAKTAIFTYNHTAPEILFGNTEWNWKADVWSLGVVLFRLCAKKLPFPGDEKTPFLLYKSITEQAVPPIPDRYSAELKQIIAKKMLVRDLDERATVDELCKMTPFDKYTRCLDKDLNSHLLEKENEELRRQVEALSKMLEQHQLAPINGNYGEQISGTAKEKKHRLKNASPLPNAVAVKGVVKTDVKLVEAAGKGDLSEVIKLLANGADVNSEKNYGWTALMRAARCGHLEIVSQLLANGADVNSKSIYEWTALMEAARYGHTEIVSQLLANGADVNSKSTDEWTALMSAARYGHLEIVFQLLANGADVNSKDKDGWTALILASSENHDDVVKLLKVNGAT